MRGERVFTTNGCAQGEAGLRRAGVRRQPRAHAERAPLGVAAQGPRGLLQALGQAQAADGFSQPHYTDDALKAASSGGIYDERGLRYTEVTEDQKLKGKGAWARDMASLDNWSPPIPSACIDSDGWTPQKLSDRTTVPATNACGFVLRNRTSPA